MAPHQPLTAHETNVSFGALLGVSALMLTLVLLDMPSSSQSTANVLQALTSTPSVQLEDSLLPEPRAVAWGGYISRILVGGEGLELVGSDAPGGVFQAYGVSQLPILEGQVLIRGVWRGYTCAYGGYKGRCVPDVEIESIEPLPADY